MAEIHYLIIIRAQTRHEYANRLTHSMSHASERAFVAGATGYVGREVVAALRAAGVETWAHVRPDSPRLREWRERFGALGAQVDVTAWDAVAMRDRLTTLSPTVVFALLGTTQARASAAARAHRARTSRGACALHHGTPGVHHRRRSRGIAADGTIDCGGAGRDAGASPSARCTFCGEPVGVHHGHFAGPWTRPARPRSCGSKPRSVFRPAARLIPWGRIRVCSGEISRCSCRASVISGWVGERCIAA